MPSNKQLVLHPLLFALFPPLFLLGTNTFFLDFSAIVVPSLVSLAVVGAFWLVLSWRLRDHKQAAIVVSLSIFLLTSFGALLDMLNSLSSNRGLELVEIEHQVIVANLAVVAVAAGLYVRLRHRVSELTYLLNVVGTILVCVPLTNAVSAAYQRMEARELLPDRKAFNQLATSVSTAIPGPDIYYIVLDGYGRGDFLKNDFGFDNSAFLDSLRARGFFVAEKSRANYPQTLLSIASSLNFAYLQEPLGDELAPVHDRVFARELLQNSRAARLLKRAGYKTVSIAGAYDDAELRNVDVRIRDWWLLTPFQVALLQMTPIPWALNQLGQHVFYQMHRENILRSYENLAACSELPGPKFVYSYIFAAHPPFVFGPNGEEVFHRGRYKWDDGEKLMSQDDQNRSAYMQAYRDQVKYLNGRLLDAIDAILARSERSPVIIIQGDHGPGTRFSITKLEDSDVYERYSILNAYHLPRGGRDLLYDSISPVNSFRVVFNHYFGTDFPILEDRSYYTPWLEPYNYQSVSFESEQQSQEAVSRKSSPSNSGS